VSVSVSVFVSVTTTSSIPIPDEVDRQPTLSPNTHEDADTARDRAFTCVQNLW
jgi:hypothetical protein